MAILLCSLLLNVVPLWWGLPTQGDVSWAFDEIPPSAKGDVARGRHFGGYPPFHYQVLRVAYSPVRWLVDADLVDWTPRQVSMVLRCIGRLISVLMAVGLVMLVHRLTWQATESAGAAHLAAWLLACSPTFVYYAKLINLEAPYLLWFGFSLLFFWLALQKHRLRDYLLFGLSAALATCTKDQAAGLYPLPALVLWLDLTRHEAGRISLKALARTLFDRRLLGGLAVGAIAFVLIHNLLFDWAGFRYHLRVIFGPASEKYQVWEWSLKGQVAMASQALRHLVFLIGVPANLAVCVGILAAWRQRRTSLLLLSFPVSYYLFFIVPAGYHYDRFLLPVAAVVAIFAGLGVVTVARNLRWRFVSASLVGLLALHGLARAATLDALMWNDARYSAERWVQEHMDSSERMVAIGRFRQNNVRIGPLRDWVRLRGRTGSLLRRWDVDYIVWNPLEAEERGFQMLASRLTSGRLNYQVASVHSWEPPVDLLPMSGVWTNLSRVNPEIVVARKIDEWGISRAEAMKSVRALWAGENEDWEGLARSVWNARALNGRRSIGPEAVAIGLGPTGWARPDQPAFMVLRNGTTESVEPVLRVRAARTVSNPLLPVLVQYSGGQMIVQVTSGSHLDVVLPSLQSGALAGVLVAPVPDVTPQGSPVGTYAVRVQRID